MNLGLGPTWLFFFVCDSGDPAHDSQVTVTQACSWSEQQMVESSLPC